MSECGNSGMRPPQATSSRPLHHTGVKPETTSDRDSGGSDSDDDGALNQTWQSQEAPSPTESMPSSVQTSTKAADGTSENPPMPMQKRRRVTRACDECRRKKIKCDGKQPCTHCQVYSYECTYDKPSNRRRNPAPQYIEALEDRLDRAENLLRQFVPDLNLADANLDPAVQQEFRNRERARALAAGVKKEDLKALTGPDAQILSMIESLGQLDLDDKGVWDFHGISSGAVFLKKIQEHFPPGMLQAPAYSRPFLPKAQNQPGLLNVDSPGSSAGSPWHTSDGGANILPPRETVDRLCYLSLNCATCLIRIVHMPSFTQMLERLYEIPTQTYEARETKFLGLVYAVMALGCLYDVSQDSDPQDSTTYKAAVEQGVKYYNTARIILQDIAQCQDLTTLQALLFMILFLQGTSKLTGCYAFVGIAFRSAITMGLHRHIPHPKMSKIEDQVRRRVFYIIRQMDTYVSAMLGFPMMNIDDAVDQPYPDEVNDEYIKDSEILTPPPGTPSYMQAFNAHTKLMEILAKIIRFVYPLKGVKECVMKGGRPNATYLISYRRILEVETELQNWSERLPDAWKPSNEGDPEVVRVRHLLRFAYAHVQMLLYRPFIHYSSPRLTQSKSIDQRAFHCAASAVNVSRNIVHIGTEIRKQGVLIGPYWFIFYTELFAILSLVFYVLENPDKAGSDDILADATAGRDMIARISRRSQTAEKVSSLLNVLFERLPERLGKAKGRAIPSKKRSAPAPKDVTGKSSHSTPPGQPSRRSSEMTRSTSGSLTGEKPPSMPHRASVDSVPSSSGAVPDRMMAPDLQGIVFDNMANGGSESTTASPTGSGYQQHQPFPAQQVQRQSHRPQHQPHQGTANPVYNDMFSSSDPFAYPNQPLLELAAQQPRHHSMNNVGPQRQDSGVFSMPNGMFDDIEGQLMHIPSYLMENQDGQGGVDLSTQMYEAPGMLALGQAGQAPPHQQQPQPQHHMPHQGQQIHSRLQGLYVEGGSMAGDWNPNFFQDANFRG